MQTVIETPTGWMIRCAGHTNGWHEFPKVGRPGASWTFSGNLEKPTFSPSMNEGVNLKSSPHHQADVPESRCHFTVTDGKIEYHGDCTHALRGKMDLFPWPDAKVKLYAALCEDAKAKALAAKS